MINAIACSLADLSSIYTDFPDTIGYYNEKCSHCNFVQTSVTRKIGQNEKTISRNEIISAHFDNWSIYFGTEIKAQMATIILFENLLGTCYNLLNDSWSLVS